MSKQVIRVGRYEGLRIVGSEVLSLIDAGTSRDEAVKKVLTRRLNEEIKFNIRKAPTNDTERDMRIRATGRGICAATSWGESGFPQIIPSHKLAASLMATRMPKECIPSLHMPWKTWIIRVPENLLYVRDLPELNEDGNGFHKETVPVSEMWIFENDWGGWAFREQNDWGAVDGKTIVFAMSDRTFAGPRLHIQNWEQLSESCEFSDEAAGANEAVQMGCRLILGCVAELNSRGITRSSIRRDSLDRKKRGLPVRHTFELTREVRVDCREWVRGATMSGLSAKKRIPTIQCLVRGHWKPILSQKIGRLVYVEPYWRGPEDAPIAVRPHILSGGAA